MLSIPQAAQSLINWRYAINEESVLNNGKPPDKGNAPGILELKQAINAIRTQAFATSNGKVDYSGLSSSTAYEEYRQATRHLQSFDPTTLNTLDERLAFWINLYNALVIDGVIAFGITGSVNELPGFFWKAAYCINGYRFSTFDIEYGVLRANAGHPAIPGPQFDKDDPRAQNSLEILDARLHFALVCASRSCPPIALYTEENIDHQLDLAARSFINGGGVEIDRDNRVVYLSKIFQWYAPDFGGPWLGLGNMRPVLDYVAPYINDEVTSLWLREGDYKVKYTPYDWNLNLLDVTQLK